MKHLLKASFPFFSKGGGDKSRLQRTQSIEFVEAKEYIFKKALWLSGFLAVLLLLGIFITLGGKSLLSLKTFGLSFFYQTTWDPVRDNYGALPFLVGTLLTSVLALIISLPFSFSLAVYLADTVKKGWLESALNSTLDLLAGIPSVIYGFWGIFVLVPMIRKVQMALGFTPYGVGIFTASIILALMIIPYSASISREVISLVPKELKEASLALGATPYETMMKVILPYAKSGIFAGSLMSFGRAISETMAVTMLIGNVNKLPTSLFSPGNTLASVLANEFSEASEALYLSSLVELALVLFLVTAAFSLIGRVMIKKMTVNI